MASGLDIVLRASELLLEEGRTDICFLLVGDGASRTELERKIADRGLTNVVMTGMLSKDRMPEVISNADACLVHLIRRELFQSVIPSKIFEASAMGKPVILGVAGLAASLVADADSGICIEPENEAQQIVAVKKLADDPAAAESFGANGQKLVSRYYNYDLLADEYLKRLEECLDVA